MNSLEEKLWNYIDGSCSASEKIEVEQLIASDVLVRNKYNELLLFNNSLLSVEPDEPSMRFTQNTIERINREFPLAPLKTFVDKRIINSIAFIMIAGVIALLLYSFSNITFSSTTEIRIVNPIDMNWLPHINFINIFLFADVILGLFLIDKYLSGKRMMEEMNAKS